MIDKMLKLVTRPGEILKQELEEIGVTPTTLARQIEVPPNRITQIIKGQRGITGDTALRLGHWFGTGARFWLNLQAHYDLLTAEREVGREVAALPSYRRAS
jgi:addiction module HigA family antidote